MIEGTSLQELSYFESHFQTDLDILQWILNLFFLALNQVDFEGKSSGVFIPPGDVRGFNHSIYLQFWRRTASTKSFTLP